GRLSLHLHIAIEGLTCCEIIARNHENRIFLNEIFIEGRSGQRDPEPIKLSYGDEKKTMLVCVYQFAEPSQRLIPCIARLRTVDLVKRVCGNLAISKVIKTGLQRIGIGKVHDVKTCDSSVV